jgi:CheY-like chemotaxis protein
VLVVDDDPAIRESVAEILELEGYAPMTAGNGQEALAVVAQTAPDLVLLDMRMPIMDGWSFAREIAPRRAGLKLLVMTAAQDAEAWANQVQADGFLAKPFDLDVMLAEVHRLCPPTR